MTWVSDKVAAPGTGDLYTAVCTRARFCLNVLVWIQCMAMACVCWEMSALPAHGELLPPAPLFWGLICTTASWISTRTIVPILSGAQP